eukprot:Sdes_comp13675_c0_seq1m3263
MSRKFMLAVDDSDNSLYAFEYLRTNILKKGDKVFLIHIAPPILASREKLFQESEQNAKVVISKFEKLLLNAKLEYESVLKFGDPRQLILDLVELHKPELLILGSYGLGHRGKVRLGSVCSHISNYCPCPLLIVRNPVIEKVDTTSFDTKWPDEKVSEALN